MNCPTRRPRQVGFSANYQTQQNTAPQQTFSAPPNPYRYGSGQQSYNTSYNTNSAPQQLPQDQNQQAPTDGWSFQPNLTSDGLKPQTSMTGTQPGQGVNSSGN